MDGRKIGTFQSDSEGRVHLSQLDPGRVSITEVSSPDGYLLDDKPREVLLEPGKTASLTVENTPASPLIIKKVSTDGTPLAGAKIRVTRMDGSLVGDFVTGRGGYITVPNVEPGWFICEELEAPAGFQLDNTPKKIELKRGEPAILELENSPLPGLQIRKVSENGIPIAGVSITIQYKTGEVVGTYKTDAAGLISLPDLEPGWYTCYESQTVPGFLLDMTPQDVLLEEGKVATLTFVNKAVPGLTILKKDSISGKGIGGVEIELRWETGELIGTYTTDSTGRIYAPLEAEKTVVAREVKTLPEYRLDPTERSVTLESGKANELIFENDPYPYLIIQKIDRSTKEPLSGVQFKISDDLGHEVGTYTTSATGRIVLTGINEGHYQVQEISPAPSYRPDNTVYDVYLSWGKTTTITIKNEKLASFLLKKVDMTAEYCSKKCGVITVRTSTQMSPQNPMFSFIYGAGGNRYSQTRSEGQRSLMLADEITRLDTQKCIALIGGHKPLLLCKVKPEEIPGFTELQPTRIMDYVPLWYALDQQRVELAKTRPVSAEFSTEAAVPPSPAVPERPWTQQPVQQMLTVEEPAMELQRYDFVHAHSPKTAASEERIGNMRRYTGIPDARKVMEQASESNDAINQTKYGE